MKNSLYRSVAVVTAIAVPLALVPAFSQTVGVNTAVRNIVKVKANEASAAINALVKQRVAQGNEIATAPASTLQVMLLDQSSLTVGPNGRLKVDRFVYDADRRASAVGVSIVKGAFRFLSGKSTHANPGQTALRTPIASIGIRGTIVEGHVGEIAANVASGETGLSGVGVVDPNTASMIVLRGPGPNAVGGETRGEISVTSGGVSVTVNSPGQAVFVPRAGAAPIVFTLSTLGYQSFDSALRTSPSSTNAVQRAQNQQARANAQSNALASTNPAGTNEGARGATESVSNAGSGLSTGLTVGISIAAATALGVIIAISNDDRKAASPS